MDKNIESQYSMSVYYNQTNITPGTSQFITRQEVLEGFSTIASDLSGFNFNNLFANPNPQFSSITMNASGTIGGGTLVGATSALQVSSVLTTYNRLFPNATDPFILGMRANASAAYTPLALGGLAIKNNTFTTEPTQYLTNTTLGWQTSLTNQYPVLQWNAATNNLGLSNISSINGNPPSGATTFTNLTGVNLTTTGQLTSPQVVSLSSINGVPYQVPYNAGWSGSSQPVLASGVPQTVATITLPAGYFQQNTTYIYDVPIVLNSMPPGSPSGFVCNIGIRLGGNGQINYQIPLTIFASSQGLQINLTGIAQTNTSSPPSAQTIEIIAVQNSGASFNPNFTSPASTGGLNVYTIKPLS